MATSTSEAVTSGSKKPNGVATQVASVLPDVEEIDGEIRLWARERPLFTLGMALLAGYVAGRILSRI